MRTVNETREQWLERVADLARASLFGPAGYTVPLNVRVTCGFPSRKATGKRSRRIGECWPSQASDGNAFEIFVSPVVEGDLDVAAILVHELVHATVGLEHGHDSVFGRCARAVGLDGKLTATVAGDAFKRWFAAQTLTPYPHRKLNATSFEKKQPTRLLKVSCPCCAEDGEPYIVRMSRSTLDRGAPICPIHHCEMEEA